MNCLTGIRDDRISENAQLAERGFVVERREGRSRFYRADQAALGSLRSIVEEHWRGGLDRLKHLAEDEQRSIDQRDRDRS